MRPLASLALLLLLAACGSRTTDDSGATPAEAQALNEVAATLDNSSVAPPSSNEIAPGEAEQ